MRLLGHWLKGALFWSNLKENYLAFLKERKDTLKKLIFGREVELFLKVNLGKMTLKKIYLLSSTRFLLSKLNELEAFY